MVKLRNVIFGKIVIIVACIFLSSVSSAMRLEYTPFSEPTGVLNSEKNYATASDTTLSQTNEEKIPFSKVTHKHRNSTYKGPLWIDLMIALKPFTEDSQSGVMSKNSENSPAAHFGSTNIFASKEKYVEPFITSDGNVSGILLLVKEEPEEEVKANVHRSDDVLSKQIPLSSRTVEHELHKQQDYGLNISERPTAEVTHSWRRHLLRTSERNAPHVNHTHASSENILISSSVSENYLHSRNHEFNFRNKRSTVSQGNGRGLELATTQPTNLFQERAAIRSFTSHLLAPLLTIPETFTNNFEETRGKSAYPVPVYEVNGIQNNMTGSVNRGQISQETDNVVSYNAGRNTDVRNHHFERDYKQASTNPESYLIEIPNSEFTHQHDFSEKTQDYVTPKSDEYLLSGRTDTYVATTVQNEEADGRYSLDSQPSEKIVYDTNFYHGYIPNTNNKQLLHSNDKDKSPTNVELLTANSPNSKLSGFRSRDEELIDSFANQTVNFQRRKKNASSFLRGQGGSRIQQDTRISRRKARLADIRRLDDNDIQQGAEMPETQAQTPYGMQADGQEGHQLKASADNATSQTSVFDALMEGLERCLRRQTLSALDRLADVDVATLWPGVEMVRVGDAASRRRAGPSSGDNSNLPDDENERWAAVAVDKLAGLLRTHVIRLQLTSGADNESEEGRRLRYRHQYKHMFPLVVMGYMVMSSFLVPLGFQLMAVLSGKALLLSKMALAMAGLTGFKRLLYSGYGPEYPAPPPAAVVHHESYPLYHEHHAAWAK